MDTEVDEKKRHLPSDPHRGPAHRGAEHPMAVRQGVSTIVHRTVHKRARRDRRPKDEKLTLWALSGNVFRSYDVTGGQACNIPCFPWHGSAFFWDWGAHSIPASWTPTTAGGTAFHVDYPALGQFTMHPPLVPLYDDAATTPTWYTTNNTTLNNTPAGGWVSNSYDYRHNEMKQNANYLRVSGLYYHETLVFQGKIHVNPNTVPVNCIGNEEPWVRFMAIQWLDADDSTRGYNGVLLSDFYPHLPTAAIHPHCDPDYERRRGAYDKGETPAFNQRYRILHDQTWQLTRNDGQLLSSIPVKLKLAPRALRDRTQTVADGAHTAPKIYGPAYEGRIFYQFFTNADIPVTAGQQEIHLNQICTWAGNWTLEIEDGGF